jgi:hypothetical protein
VSNRPAPRKSGRAPKREADELVEVLEPLEPGTLAALKAEVHLQNHRRGHGHGLKSRHLSRVAADLEVALISGQPQDVIDGLCIDAAATVLRIKEQGDGH